MEKMSNKDFGFGTQIRKSPYFDSTVKWGATGFSVYNHMYTPRDFGDPEKNFWNLIEKAILCDVAVERQVEITGPDAYKFIQILTPRDLSKLAIGQCKYVLITNNDGGILNDPILLRLAENHFWLSLADADINTYPFKLGLDRLVSLDTEINFIGKNALIKIKHDGIKKKQVGLIINCTPLTGPNTTFWPVKINGKTIGKVTSAVY